MRYEDNIITDEQKALKAVRQNGDALQYVREKSMFFAIAEKLGIEAEE